MSLGYHHSWLPPGHLRPPDTQDDLRSVNGFPKLSSGTRTPSFLVSANAESSQTGNSIPETDPNAEEDSRVAMFRELYKQSESKIDLLFGSERTKKDLAGDVSTDAAEPVTNPLRSDDVARPSYLPKRPARKLDDDDYDDYDEDEEADAGEDAASSPAKATPVRPSQEPSGFPSPSHQSIVGAAEGQKELKRETVEDIRKKLEEDQIATAEAVKKSFQTMFYTLENDRDAMLDQQRLEESERQVEAELSGQASAGNTTANSSAGGYGPLSSANLGASSLTLKNLIARIDIKRNMVQASDAELRSLMSEVRKNRSKWASEDKIGQEELYEAAEKVLNELKAMTEHSTAFLTRVNKRDAPDYYNIIKHPMDLGTMTKKLKAYQYKSKQEFVDDLNLIWSNCLKYNTNPEHFLRKHALYMKKETEKLVPLIPDIIIRDRAEVEAEERRLQLAELDGAEESDDEPIMSSRGRKAPSKTSKKGAAAVRSTPTGSDGPGGATSSQLSAPLRTSEFDATNESIQNGFATPPPPPSTQTPTSSVAAAGALDIHGDGLEIDGLIPANTALSALSVPGLELEDAEYKIWKQVTKRDRALIAAERHRLFKGDKLNPEEPALLRTKAGMRRWMRNQKLLISNNETFADSNAQAKGPEAGSETFAEGIEEDDRVIPGYYDVLSGIPDLPERLRWREDDDGNVVDNHEEFLRVLPKGSFNQPDSKLSRQLDANMRQIQETRKICSKIGIVKQMQLQSQMYQNQFHKYQAEPFIEKDVPTHVMNDAGPVIAPWVCKAALQRSVAKICFHAGFEEYQPSALDAMTDIAADFFQKIGETLKSYMEAPKVPATDSQDDVPFNLEWKPAYSQQQIVLHTLSAVGSDVEALESYVRDDVERLGTKFGTVHERLRSLLAEMLRPALADGGEDGSNAFADGSEQFVRGDFAEDIDEDFFGFKELGLDKEFGLATLSVPLHLLQNRMYNAAQAQNTSASQAATLFPPPPPYPRITMKSLPLQIGLIQDFFHAKLQANNGEPLVEDLELPPKQRPMAAKPRLPASGKITAPGASGATNSPQKRAAASGQNQASKSGTGEPSKKKIKKNSGVGAIVPEPIFESTRPVGVGMSQMSAPNGLNAPHNAAPTDGGLIAEIEFSNAKAELDGSLVSDVAGVESPTPKNAIAHAKVNGLPNGLVEDSESL